MCRVLKDSFKNALPIDRKRTKNCLNSSSFFLKSIAFVIASCYMNSYVHFKFEFYSKYAVLFL